MALGKSDLRQAASGYMERTHRPLNGLVFILPLLAAYEAGALFFDQRLLAIKHLKELLELFGATGRFLPPVLVIVVLLTWHILSRQEWRIDGGAMLGMALESALLMIPLVLLAMLYNKVFAAAITAEDAGGGPRLATTLLTGVGAGIYEEFLFRLAGMSLVLFVCVDVFGLPKKHTAAVGIIVTAVIFSLYHFLGSETFDWPAFIFRALAGVYLAFLYVARGFGIAVGAHAFYNMVVAIIS